MYVAYIFMKVYSLKKGGLSECHNLLTPAIEEGYGV